MAKKARKRATSTVVEEGRPMAPPSTTAATTTNSSSSASAAAAEASSSQSASAEVAPEGDGVASNKNEIRFGKHLASSDKRVRDRTVFALREWLHQRSKGGALTDLDLLKVLLYARVACIFTAF